TLTETSSKRFDSGQGNRGPRSEVRGSRFNVRCSMFSLTSFFAFPPPINVNEFHLTIGRGYSLSYNYIKSADGNPFTGRATADSWPRHWLALSSSQFCPLFSLFPPVHVRHLRPNPASLDQSLQPQPGSDKPGDFNCTGTRWQHHRRRVFGQHE